jgi:hypothetical protein
MTRDPLADLIALFTIEKKHTLKQHCRVVTITQADLISLIMTAKAGQLPWYHLAHHRNFVPEHLSLTEKDLVALASNEVGRPKPAAQKTANKIATMFDQQRRLSGHMFFNEELSDWHFFYIDHRAIAPKNHWHGGSHIHFINKLWPDRNAQSVWKDFCTSAKPKINSGFHVRFKRTKR